MEYKISNELTPNEVNQVIERKDPILRKPIEAVKNVGAMAAGGALAAGAALSNIKVRTDAVKTID